MNRSPAVLSRFNKSSMLKIGMACLLAIGTFLTTISPACSQQAEADGSAYLSIGSDILYAGFFTTWMWADGAIAYCANPEIPTPAAGTYAKSSINAPSGRNQDCAAVLWFGYGSPGFEASMWPSTWYDGSSMTDARYVVLTHILLANAYSSSADYALFGCTDDFKSWCRTNVIGYNAAGALVNQNATGIAISSRSQEIPSNFHTFQLHTGHNTQVVMSSQYVPYGAIELTKTSGIPEMTDQNPCYSLANAEYTVFRDEACNDQAGIIVTDENGYGKLDNLEPGMYYVKETKSAPGYALDQTMYKAAVTSNETTALNGGTVHDIPQSNPIDIAVAKVDSSAADSSNPQGNATLAGAEFTIQYYKGRFSSVEAAKSSGDPTRTWVLKTNEKGQAHLNDECKVSGDNFYRTSDGTPSIPLGTVLVTETKAPLGYNLDDGSGNAPQTFLIEVTSDSSICETVDTYNQPQSENSVMQGDFRLVKEALIEIYGGASNGQPQEQKRILVPGVQFQLINDSPHAIVSPENGQLIQPGETVCTITTDENGMASTKDSNADANGWSKPAKWSGALAYGTYIVHEIIPEDVAAAFKKTHGKELLTVEDWKITISENGQYDAPALVTNKIPQTPLKVIKADAETGKRIPLPCSFQIIDAQGSLVTHTTQGSDAVTTDTWSTNAAGEVTLPLLLEQGSYTLIEVEAPEGYVLAQEGITFEVGAIHNSWDNPLEVTLPNAPQKGTISIRKTDASNENPLDSCTFSVRAATDIATPDGTIRAQAGEIVATLTTNEDGVAASSPLYLGTYTICETEAKDGFVLDQKERTVALTYQGQHVSIFDESLDATNQPTCITLKKTNTDDPDQALPGATFRIWNDQGTYDESIETDGDGLLRITHIKRGTYHLQETSAPEGFAVTDVDDEGNARIHTFTVNERGLIEVEGASNAAPFYGFAFENMPKTIKTTALDKTSNAHEGQARKNMTIVDVVEYSGLIPGKEYVLAGVLMDKESGKPVLDANGNTITAEKAFTPKDFKGSVKLEFTFDGSALAGHSLVAFETIYHEGKECLTHADIRDESQTVSLVDIRTTAHIPNSSNQEASPSKTTHLADTVTYENLTPGKTYKLFATLHDAQSGAAIANKDGSSLVGEATFTPSNPSGSVDVKITVDTSKLAGKRIVFFELLTDELERPIAEHADLQDTGQTITIKEREPLIPASGDSTILIAGMMLIALSAASGAAALAWRKRNR